MKNMPGHTWFDFAQLGERDRYKLLIGTVIPRPIALVTTLSKDGCRHRRGKLCGYAF
ncbi:hypothetical protein [Erwinia sp. MYb416]|uniref:hypothetical protein n=1 Tax=Erwinia sp. MYb416 TaxID=3108532 RepID=UPI0030AC99EC